MKRVLLIARAKTPETVRRADLFAGQVGEGLSGKDVSLESCELSELLFEVSKDAISITHPSKAFDIRDFDLVIMRNVGSSWVEAQVVAQYCDEFDVRYTDTYLNRPLPDSKIANQFRLWRSGIKQWPRTVYGPSVEMSQRMPDFGSRAVLKDSNGLKGRLNFIVESEEDVLRITGQYPEVRFMLQEYIPNEADFRVLAMGGIVPLIIRRSAVGDTHLNNTSEGAAADIVPVDQFPGRLIKLSLDASRELGLQVAGVDIMFDLRSNEPYFIEVNNAPQISSGSFTEEKRIAYSDMVHRLAFEATVSHTELAEQVVGAVEEVRFPGLGDSSLFARVDTGAQTSSIWATDITEVDGVLKVRFASSDYEINSHQVAFDVFSKVRVVSSMGHKEERYRVEMPVVVKGKQINAAFTLADRSSQTYPVLIGRSTLRGNFIVDVSDPVEQNGVNLHDVSNSILEEGGL